MKSEATNMRRFEQKAHLLKCKYQTGTNVFLEKKEVAIDCVHTGRVEANERPNN